MFFSNSSCHIIDILRQDDVENLLRSMMTIPRLEGYWLDHFLSYISLKFSNQLAEFFFRRAELAASTKSFEFRPANHGPYARVPLRFDESPDATAILQRAWSRLRVCAVQDDIYLRHHAVDVFDAMFPSTARGVTSFFEERLRSTTDVELQLMSRILRNAGQSFIFAERAFLVRFLDRCGSARRKPWRML